MQAIILAAGMGKRLKELTYNNTKCMVKVNGVSLIERMLKILDKKNMSKIIIVIGYKGKELIDYINKLDIQTPIVYVENTVYDKTNNIYSLALAKDYLISEDTLLLESDLIFEESIIDSLLEDNRESLVLVDNYKSWMDGTCLVANQNDKITDFVSKENINFKDKENYYKTVNIYKFSKAFSKNIYVPFLEAYALAMGNNEYYESVIKLIAVLDNNGIEVKRLKNQVWYEIDDVQDLDIAESLFSSDIKERYRMIQKRFGGFWRYPELMDFAYLVNPYYPPKRMLEEIKSNFEVLVTQYPSGQETNSLLVSNYFNVNKESIVVGNGAAELINVLMRIAENKVGIIKPSFEEYANRCPNDRRIIYYVQNESFRYSINDIKQFINENAIETIIVINPDNPSGNYIEKEQMVSLIDYCEQKKVKIIVDESFIDFAQEAGSILEKDIINKYRNLVIIKSISKSFGIPGLRLGIAVSSDIPLIEKMKKEVSIWNINAFAEYYLQISEKYKSEYQDSLYLFRNARQKMLVGLKQIDFLEVYPTEANYFMCKLKGFSSSEVCGYLLENNILIKDLSDKINDGKQYVRIAIRKEEENEKLIELLKNIRSNK